MRRLVALFMLIGLGLLAAMPLVAQDQAQMTPEQQKDWFVQFVEGQLSTPERQIRISNIDGALSSTASIREVTISDKEGVWLRINNAAIDWDQGALFGGRLLVRELKADSIEYIRNVCVYLISEPFTARRKRASNVTALLSLSSLQRRTNGKIARTEKAIGSSRSQWTLSPPTAIQNLRTR